MRSTNINTAAFCIKWSLNGANFRSKNTLARLPVLLNIFVVSVVIWSKTVGEPYKSKPTV